MTSGPIENAANVVGETAKPARVTAPSILPTQIDPNGPFPRLNRRLRLGIIGSGRISQTKAMAAWMTDYWEVVAGALSSDPQTAHDRGTAL